MSQISGLSNTLIYDADAIVDVLLSSQALYIRNEEVQIER